MRSLPTQGARGVGVGSPAAGKGSVPGGSWIVGEGRVKMLVGLGGWGGPGQGVVAVVSFVAGAVVVAKMSGSVSRADVVVMVVVATMSGNVAKAEAVAEAVALTLAFESDSYDDGDANVDVNGDPDAVDEGQREGVEEEGEDGDGGEDDEVGEGVEGEGHCGDFVVDVRVDDGDCSMVVEGVTCTGSVEVVASLMVAPPPSGIVVTSFTVVTTSVTVCGSSVVKGNVIVYGTTVVSSSVAVTGTTAADRTVVTCRVVVCGSSVVKGKVTV